jgi:hypothetical protein
LATVDVARGNRGLSERRLEWTHPKASPGWETWGEGRVVVDRVLRRRRRVHHRPRPRAGLGLRDANRRRHVAPVIVVNCGVSLTSSLATTGVDWRVALPFTAAGLVGAVAGNHLASRARAPTLLRWFAVLLVAVATYTLVRSASSL